MLAFVDVNVNTCYCDLRELSNGNKMCLVTSFASHDEFITDQG